MARFRSPEVVIIQPDAYVERLETRLDRSGTLIALADALLATQDTLIGCPYAGVTLSVAQNIFRGAPV